MRTCEEVRYCLSDHNLKAVADACGLHYNAVYRFMAGKSDPKVSTLEKLNHYIDKKEARNGYISQGQ